MAEENIKIKKSYEKTPDTDLKWGDKERKNIENRILSLRDDQIASLQQIVGVCFYKKGIDDVLQEIRKNKNTSIHLSIIVEEARNKEDLIWWVEYFEKHNK